ncbi:histidine phosphatase family protein [Streptococcus sp. ZJ93]|uniref:histidine phosphatase family protein n=1 Tax=Streptococcus handemini TaxID=3161188 RepID=UPI0032ECAE5B
MKLYLIRHGETYLNKYKRMQGWSDSPLTEKGIEMAKQCGQRLKEYPISHMITTDLGRTIETGRIIGSILNLTDKVRQMKAFRETFFGSFEGSFGNETWSTVAKSAGFTSVIDFYQSSSIAEVMDYFHEVDSTGDAEDYQAFISRIQDGLKQLEEQYGSDDHIVLVTHGNVIRNIAYLIDPTIDLAEELVNAGITILELTLEGRTLLSYNNNSI